MGAKSVSNIVELKDRAKVLSRTRNLKMARSSHAYVRGSTAQFYEWLAAAGERLPKGPNIWICGDCHVGNLGPLADSKGRVAIQIRDLDQSVIGNPAHDIIRLGLSLASAARGSDLPGVITARMLESLVHGYGDALGGDFDVVEAAPSEQVLHTLDEAMRRRWRHLAAERLQTRKAKLPLGKKFWPVTNEERQALGELFDQPEIHELVTRLQGRADTDAVRLMDVAYWVKGCSSLGRLRYAALLETGDDDAARYSILDVKEAIKPAAPRAADAKMPRDNGVRVVTGALALSPYLGERMRAARLMGKAVFVRELLPQDLKLEVESLEPAEASALAAYLGSVVGRAHGRQMDLNTRREWKEAVMAQPAEGMDAPGWLWRSVVDLLSSHEAAYLEHCRQFALEEDRASLDAAS